MARLVSGAGTRLTVNGIDVGNSGMGMLAIGGGASVTSNGFVNIGERFSGMTKVDGANSTLIAVGGGIVVAGFSGGSSYGSGTLSITNGGNVTSGSGDIGDNAVSLGIVIVDGAGSSWTSSSFLDVGHLGGGTISIANRARVSSVYGSIGENTGSTGLASVDSRSIWTISNSIYVGDSGTATLAISGGGTVTSSNVSINNTSLLAIDVGRGSILSIVGDYPTITNNGTIRILAGAGVPASSTKYAPISATTWSGNGAYQAIGGTWANTSHTFTVSPVATGAASYVTLNLASVQRAPLTDSGTDWA